MSYENFQKTLDSLNIVSHITYATLKEKYLKLSRKYHSDMPEGDQKSLKRSTKPIR
jgi:DnaJ-class molecular chaperone